MPRELTTAPPVQANVTLTLEGNYSSLVLLCDNANMTLNECAEPKVREMGNISDEVSLTMHSVHQGSIIIDFTIDAANVHTIESVEHRLNASIGQADEFVIEDAVLSFVVGESDFVIVSAETTPSPLVGPEVEEATVDENGSDSGVIVGVVLSVCVVAVVVVGLLVWCKRKSQGQEDPMPAEELEEELAGDSEVAPLNGGD